MSLEPSAVPVAVSFKLIEYGDTLSVLLYVRRYLTVQ